MNITTMKQKFLYGKKFLGAAGIFGIFSRKTQQNEAFLSSRGERVF
jgi:hypothetical protein